MVSFNISASIVCGNMLKIGEEIKSLERAGVEYIHFDVMDGLFVPRYGLLPEMLEAITKITNIPVDVHMMVTNPEQYIEVFAKAGAKIFFVHSENNVHLHRTLKKIKEFGMEPGVVLNFATPIEVIDYIKDDINYIMLMGINPGIVGHKTIPGIYDKIKDVKEKIKNKKIKIMIDGGVTPETSSKMIKQGADILVCGASTIFRPHEGSLEEIIPKYRAYVEGSISNLKDSISKVDNIIKIEYGSRKISSEHQMKIEKHIYSREKCPLCLSRNLSEPISPHKDLKFPVLPVCVETPREEDNFAPFNIGMCNECGLILLKEVVNPEILYKIFHSDGIGKVWEEHYAKFAKLIRKHNQKGKLLEIGAGQGKLIKKLLEMNFSEIEVMDPQYEGPIENVKLHKELLTNDSAQKLNEEFDAVVSSHTLEHFLEFKEYFENSWKVLKKGGLLFTSIPNQELGFSKGYGNMLNYEHPSVCMNAHWFYLHYKYGFMIREISFFQDHSVQIVAEKMEGPINQEVDVKELSKKVLDSYWNNIKERIDKVRKFAKEDKENWIFGASNLSQPLFMYGLKETHFKGVLDNSPLKHNKRLYGTNLICRKPEEVLKENSNIRVFLNLAHYNQEVFEQLKSLNPNVECVFL